MLKKLLKADEVKVGLVTGACIIGQAIILKMVLHTEADLLVSNAPVYLLVIYLIAKGQKKESESTKPLYWSVAIVLVTVLTIVRHLV
jgi:hypothetical protein